MVIRRELEAMRKVQAVVAAVAGVLMRATKVSTQRHVLDRCMAAATSMTFQPSAQDYVAEGWYTKVSVEDWTRAR